MTIQRFTMATTVTSVLTASCATSPGTNAPTPSAAATVHVVGPHAASARAAETGKATAASPAAAPSHRNCEPGSQWDPQTRSTVSPLDFPAFARPLSEELLRISAGMNSEMLNEAFGGGQFTADNIGRIVSDEGFEVLYMDEPEPEVCSRARTTAEAQGRPGPCLGWLRTLAGQFRIATCYSDLELRPRFQELANGLAIIIDYGVYVIVFEGVGRSVRLAQIRYGITNPYPRGAAPSLP